MWRLRLFGEVRLEGPSLSVSQFGTLRAAKLLVLLALSRSGRMPRTQLAEQLWPDDLYDATRLRLRQELHRLKRALGPAEELIDSTSVDASITRAGLNTDLDILRSCLGPSPLEAGHADLERILTAEFLPGWSEPWADAERIQAEALKVQAGIHYCEAQVAAGQADLALPLARALIARHPLNEPLRMAAVRAHAALGSLVNAVSEYQEFRRRLRDELQADPSAESDALVASLTKAQAKAPAAPPPPAPAASSLGGGIPNPIEPIVGRSALLAQIEDLLAGAEPQRLVTLHGPGGIGKTRLAVEAARLASQAGSRHVAFVSLSEITEVEQWPRSVLAQLDCAIPTESEPLGYLINVLGRQPCLLVMDNLEPLLPDISSGIKALLEGAGSLVILATSISPLKVGGEALVAVGPLDPETDGKEMLSRALKSSRPLASALAGGAEALEEIARRLDGYPLALKLAAARLRLLSPQALLGQLDQAGVLSTNAPDVAERHRSLDRALSSSIQSLSLADRDAMKVAAAFPDGVGLELAALALPAADFLDGLERLLDSALVSLDDRRSHARLRTLGPVRQFIQASMPQAERDAVDEKACRACVEWAAALGVGHLVPLTPAILSAVDEEAENLRAAIAWAAPRRPEWAASMALALSPYELARGRASLQPGLFASLLSRKADWPPRQRAMFELAVAEARMALTQTDLALPHIERAEELLSQDPDAELAAWAALGRASHAMRRAFKEARPAVEKALALAQEAKSDLLEARCRRLFGNICHFSKESAEAIEHLSLAADGFARMGAGGMDASAGGFLASVLWQAGRRQESLPRLAEAAQQVRAAGDPAALAFLCETQGRIALDDSRPGEAEQHFREAHRIWSTIGSDFQEADQLLSLTRALLAQDRLEEAGAALAASADKWVLDGNYGGLCQSLASLALILAQRGKQAEARDVLAYYRRFEEEHGLVLVKPELEFREEVARLAGGYGVVREPLTLEAARGLFSLLP